MQSTGVIDHFLDVFTSYIDSGFGLLGGEVGFIASTLIVIDVTLAGLFWAWGADEDIIARLVKKTLFVGVFAYLISSWNSLAQIVFQSFAGLGLKASGTSFSVADLMRPGRVAAFLSWAISTAPLRSSKRSRISAATGPSSKTSCRSFACSSPGCWCCSPSSSSPCSSSSR